MDLSNIIWVHRELINQLARNANGSHRTKTALITVISLVSQYNLNDLKDKFKIDLKLFEFF